MDKLKKDTNQENTDFTVSSFNSDDFWSLTSKVDQEPNTTNNQTVTTNSSSTEPISTSSFDFDLNIDFNNETNTIPQQQKPVQRQQQGPQISPILSLKNLTKKYGTRYAVNNVSLDVFPGQIVGFLGANGAGKSTTIKMLTGLAHITNGNAYICGKSVITSFEQAIKNVGAMIEIPVFYPYLSGYNNLKYYASLSGIKGKAAQDRINYVASLVGLANRIKDKVGNYSLGMKQRLGVAQALLNNPKLLILDEPTNGLDANGIREFRMMLKTLAAKERISILISSHILGEMENLCDIVAIIDKGRIIEVKTLDEIKRSCMQAGSQFVKCNAPNLAGKIIMERFNIKAVLQGNKVFFNAPDTSLLPQIIVNLTQNKILVYAAGDVDYSLEDVFLNIVNKNNNSTSIS